jgi:hypothetical protein
MGFMKKYLLPCQFLLQQGLFVADLCFLAPETSPQAFKSPVKSGLDRPGYHFDGCPPEVVLTRMTVKNGLLMLPDGMSYRMLVLPQVRTMTPQLLRKIRDLVKDGATVLGMPPVQSPSLSGYPECDAEVQALARELWGDDEAPAELTTRTFGKGRVIWGRDLQPKPDADYETGKALSGAKWIWLNEGHPGVSALPGTCYFRRIVKVDGAVESARLVMTADNDFEVWVNGKRIGNGDKWERGYVMGIGAQLKPGENVIAVAADNTTGEPSPAGLIAAVKIKYRDGRTQELCTDAAWEAAKTVSENWKTDAASAPEWTAARKLGEFGMAPWGDTEESPPGAADVIPDISIPIRVLAQSGLPPDFKSEPNLRYIHKKLGDADIYFVANPDTNAVEALCAFRITGKQPELWMPDTGHMETAAVYSEKDGVTQVPLRFDPSGSMFVVFRKKSEIGNRKSEIKNWPEFKLAQEIAGPWEVTFDPKWGGSAKPVTFDKLEDWSKRPEEGIRYYSGTATYRKTFNLPAPVTRHSPLFLDLGKVAVMAEVKLNGKDLGILWKPPFRLDITDAVKVGDNTLEVKVVNLWINRMIGDEQLPEDSDRKPNGTLKSWPQWLDEDKPSPGGRFTFTSWRLWKKDDALAESGLLGPVTVQTAENR